MHTASLVGTALNALALPAPRLAGRLARRLWTTPGPPRPLDADQRDLVDAATSDRLRVGRWEVVTHAWGDGARPVLLVHGWSSRAARFADLVRRLTDLGYTPVTWDAPGHGATGGPVGTILDALEIMRLLQDRHGRFHAVVAHSLGAPFAVHALREGVEADRVVLVAGVSDFSYTISGLVSVLRLRPRTVRALRAEIEQRYFGGDPTVWERFSATHAAHTLNRPFLLLHDEADRVVPWSQSQRTLEGLDGRARLVTTSGLGHNGILSDPGQLDRITDFVQGADTPARTGGD